MEYGLDSSPEIIQPESMEAVLSEPVEPDLSEPVVDDSPEQEKPDLPEPVEPDLPAQAEPGLSEPDEPDLAEPVEPSSPKIDSTEMSPDYRPDDWPSPNHNLEDEPTPESKGDKPPSSLIMPPGDGPADDTQSPRVPPDNLIGVGAPTDVPLPQADEVSTAEANSHTEDKQSQSASDDIPISQSDKVVSADDGKDRIPEESLAGKEGLTETTAQLSNIKADSSTLVDPQSENLVVASDTTPEKLTELTEQEADQQNDLKSIDAIDINQLKQDALQATYERVPEPKDYESKDSRKHYYDSLCGTLGEELAVRGIGGANLDSMVKKNFEVFDVTTPDEIASVKSHVVGNIDNAIGNYAKDLRCAMGISEEAKYEVPVNSLLEAKNNPEQWEVLKASLPEGIQEASTPEEMRFAIQEASTLRIPVDHVEQVREYLDKVVPKNPELYGIPADLSEEEFKVHMDALKDRVRPIAEGITSHDMRVANRELFQQRFGKR
jgi:hypothetical protein